MGLDQFLTVMLL